MDLRPEHSWPRPDSRWLVAGLVAMQVVLIAAPTVWSVRYAWMFSGLVLGVCLVLFSVRRALLVLFVVNVVLPAQVLLKLVLPGGVRLQEGLFVLALGFAVIDLIYQRGLRLRASCLDLPVLLFLAATAVSAAVGTLHGNSTSVLLRDVRFPLYYAVFFLVASFVDGRTARQVAPTALIGVGLAISVEYILEFLGAIDLSVQSGFVRVARRQGIVLPLALIFIVNQFVHDSRRYGRLGLLALFAPIGVATVLTVGRGMWVASGVGLLATTALWHFSRPASSRRLWHAVLLALATAALLGLAVFLFQRSTGSAIGAHAVERSRAFGDLARDVHVLGRLSSYATTLEAVARHPYLGSGQGATLVFLIFDETRDTFAPGTSWTVDNLYLALLWKMGLVGLAAFAWMCLAAMAAARRIFRRTRDAQVRAVAGGCLAALAGMASLGLTDSSMVWSRFALVFGMLFGVIAALEGGPDQTTRVPGDAESGAGGDSA